MSCITRLSKDDRVRSALKRSANLIYVFTFSILTLLIIFSIFFSVANISSNYNSLTYLGRLFSLFFTNYSSNTLVYNKLPTLWLFYLLIGLAAALCFRVGIFNIGIPGQITLSGVTIINMLKYFDNEYGIVYGWHFFLALIVSIFCSVLLSLLIGVLKLYFNTNEVVSSIFFNWIFYYISSWSFTYGNYVDHNSVGKSQTISLESYGTLLGSNTFHWFLYVLGAVVAVVMYITFKSTVLGYRLEAMVDPDVARYAGIKQRRQTLEVLAFSGLLVGIASFVYYAIQEHDFLAGAGPIERGFSSFGIALLAYNSPLGVIASSWFFTSLDINIAYVTTSTSEINNELEVLVKGVFTIMIAISPIFERIQLYSKFRNLFVYVRIDPGYPLRWFSYRLRIIRLLIHNIYQRLCHLCLRIRIHRRARKIRAQLTGLIEDYLRDSHQDDGDMEEYLNKYSDTKTRVHEQLESIGYYRGQQNALEYNRVRKVLEENFLQYKTALISRYNKRRS